MSKLHHAAFDANLVGIDPDLRIHVSQELLAMTDGPLFEQDLKAVKGAKIRLPTREHNFPDRNRLAIRFQQYIAG